MRINLIQSIMITTTIVATMGSGSVVAGDVAAGKSKAVVCSACHGADGNSINPLWPKLAGQHAAYLAKQLRAFRDGSRQDPVMVPMAAGLSDDDINNLAAFYASQEQQ